LFAGRASPVWSGAPSLIIWSIAAASSSGSTAMSAITHVGSDSCQSRRLTFELLPETYLLAPILNILVLQTGQVPSVAGRPFFIVIGFALVIARVALHFMQ
jgi:hypothetical protein